MLRTFILAFVATFIACEANAQCQDEAKYKALQATVDRSNAAYSEYKSTSEKQNCENSRSSKLAEQDIVRFLKENPSCGSALDRQIYRPVSATEVSAFNRLCEKFGFKLNVEP